MFTNDVDQHTIPDMKSAFVIYLTETPDGNVILRADSYGKGEAVFALGMDILEFLNQINHINGGDLFFSLPVDRCESVQ